jgi:hypothetical protein
VIRKQSDEQVSNDHTARRRGDNFLLLSHMARKEGEENVHGTYYEGLHGLRSVAVG